MTLGDHGITARDTLVLLKVGFTLNITNPKVYSYAVVSCVRPSLAMQHELSTILQG